MIRKSTILLALVLVAGLWLVVAASTATAASTLRACGKVTAYVPATLAANGAVTIGRLPLVIAAGTDAPASLRAGASLCLEARLNTAGQITEIAQVRADATTRLDICGSVTAYAKAQSLAAGSLTIAGRRLAVAAGTSLPAAVRVGARPCLTLALDAFGQVRKATVRANPTTTIRVCGVVSGFTRATPTSLGRLRIGARTFTVEYGTSLPASVRQGTNLCAAFGLDAFGRVDNGSVRANVASTVEACGRVAAVAAATPTSDGRLSIGGVTRRVTAGASLPGSLRAGAVVSARLTLDAFGRVSGAMVKATGATAANVCARAAVTPPPTPAPTDSPGSAPQGSGSPTTGALGAGGQGGTAAFEGKNTCGPNGAPAAAQETDGVESGPLPSTDTMMRTGATIGSMAIPAIAGGVASLLAVAATRLRRRAAPELGDGTVR